MVNGRGQGLLQNFFLEATAPVPSSPASPPLSEENVFLISIHPRILLLPRREPNLALG